MLSRSQQDSGEALRRYRPAAAALVIFIVVGALILALGTPAQSSVSLVRSLIWPTFAALAVLYFRDHVDALLSTFNQKMADATSVRLPYVDIKVGADRIPLPESGNSVTSQNVALLHTSFLRPDKTREYRDGMTYYQVELVVIAPAQTLDRIQSVTYRLDPSYPVAEYKIIDRSSRFKLKELANGTSIVRAELKLDGQSEPLYLNRFIDLRPDGPKI